MGTENYNYSGQYNQEAQGQYSQEAQGQYSQGAQGQYSQGTQGQYSQGAQGQYYQGGQGQYTPGGQMPPLGQSQLTLDQTGMGIVYPMMKKLRFISIVGIILMVIAALFLVIAMIGSIIALSSYNPYSSYDYGYAAGAGIGGIIFFFIIYIILFVVVLVALSKLCSGSGKIKNAIESMNNGVLVNGLQNISSAITIYYVLTIIGLAFFVIGIVSAIILAAAN